MSPGESLISPSQVSASDGYFEAMGAKLVAGRFINQDDTEGKPRVFVIDDRLARRFWPNGDAVGKRMYFPQDINNLMAKPREDQMITIVGVIETMRLRGLVDTQSQKIGAYFNAMRQVPARTLGIAIRTAVPPDTLASPVRQAIAQIDPEMPFYGVRTLEDRLTTSLVDRRTPMLLATGFAAVALFLAAIGIYGVLAYQVSQRRREIGIRLALGAEQGSIFNLVLREGGLIVAAGAVLGLGGAFLLRQTLQAQLYETGAMDPRVVAAVAAMLIVVALVACVLPARRAAKTDPLIALSD
jgi:predicted permease